MEYIYAALLLNKLGKEITEEYITAVVKATGVHPDESQVKSLVASLKGVDIQKAISETAVMPAAGQGQSAGAAKPAEKKEEKKEEEAAEGLSALFG
jgi:large subunit ribosomal protein L12